ncbi:MAG: sulfite exporter TauE/SafE family protein [Planctomycetia bacterium]|nr:sulfite exporter TauE/SafE family protein [Planctomycetia bacterium]
MPTSPDTPIWLHYGILCLCAAVAGGMNAVAGGGTLLTFPALMSFFGPQGAVLANATSTVALFPASLSSIYAYREDLQPLRRWITLLAAPSLLGGLVGALLLTQLPKEWFAAAVPWLIFTAALLFALQPHIARWVGIGKPHEQPHAGTLAAVLVFQFFVAVYGGYFGAGIGILMLSALAMIGLNDIHAMNGLKAVLGSLINGVAVAIFIWDGQVDWTLAAMMCVSSSLGAYGTARIARKLNRTFIRWCVIVIGFSLAAFYFWK